MKNLLAALLLWFGSGAALAQNQMEMRQQVSGGPAPTEAVKKKIPKEQQERALKMLETAEAQASGLEGGMRAYAQLQLARAYQPTDQAKAADLLQSAMAAAQEMDKDYTRTQLQQQILQQLVPLQPQKAEELLPQMEPENREPVLNALLGYYESKKDLDHALELVYRIGQEKEIPYGATARIMTALPPERSGDRLQLFTAAFASYRDHEHKNVSVGGSDFASVVLKFWQQLPRNLVHDAITELLKQAEKQTNASISMSSDQGAASFNSYYDYRLFQLLPVLKQIDESEAEELLKKNQEIKAMLTKYPQGTASFNSEPSPDAKPENRQRGMGPSYSVSMGSSGGRSGGGNMGAAMAARAVQEQQMRKIIAEAEDHPDTALAQAAGISDLNVRAGTYQMIARVGVKKDPSVARNALEKLLALVDQLDENMQSSMLSSAAQTYLQMNDNDNAKKVIERGFKLADKLLKTDTNADDPNKALKAYWPSAEAFRSFTRVAGQISPTWALTTLNEIQDPEMKFVSQCALAQQWLDISRGTTMIVTNRKGNNSMSVSTDRP